MVELIVRLLSDLKATRAVQRQASVLSLGHIQYDRCAGVAQRVVVGLLAQLALDTKVRIFTVGLTRDLTIIRQMSRPVAMLYVLWQI